MRPLVIRTGNLASFGSPVPVDSLEMCKVAFSATPSDEDLSQGTSKRRKRLRGPGFSLQQLGDRDNSPIWESVLFWRRQVLFDGKFAD